MRRQSELLTTPISSMDTNISSLVNVLGSIMGLGLGSNNQNYRQMSLGGYRGVNGQGYGNQGYSQRPQQQQYYGASSMGRRPPMRRYQGGNPNYSTSSMNGDSFQ